MPTAPKIQKVERHVMRVIMNTTKAGAKAPPHLPHIHMAPTARPRSARGIQFEKTLAAFGYAPASPMPNRKRTTVIVQKRLMSPVTAVKNDHNTGNDLAGTNPISQPTTRHFEKGIGDGEGAEYGAHLHRFQVEVGHDERCAAGDTDTVKISDD
jgi:hypothetical protein